MNKITKYYQHQLKWNRNSKTGCIYHIPFGFFFQSYFCSSLLGLAQYGWFVHAWLICSCVLVELWLVKQGGHSRLLFRIVEPPKSQVGKNSYMYIHIPVTWKCAISFLAYFEDNLCRSLSHNFKNVFTLFVISGEYSLYNILLSDGTRRAGNVWLQQPKRWSLQLKIFLCSVY